MNMKHITLILALFAALGASAQQVNPVPDYVFRNQMSVGRNAVTDTAAYFSIGPRYGATKGFMPPIVGDTATFSSGKRNGLLIFSVQKNKFLYWDSVRVQWSDMAGGSGSYILAGDTSAMLAPYLRKADTTAMLSPYYRSATASAALALKLNISDTSTMLTPYIRHAGYGLTKSGQSLLVDTLNIATRAWRQKGLDSLAALEVSGSGTTNYVPKFTAATTIENSLIFDNGTNLGVGTTSPVNFTPFGYGANFEIRGGRGGSFITSSGTANHRLVLSVDSTANAGGVLKTITNSRLQFGINDVIAATFNTSREFLINTTTDNGDYTLQNNGSLYNASSAALAISAGEVYIGSTLDSGNYKLQVFGNQLIRNSGNTFLDVSSSTANAVIYLRGDTYNGIISSNGGTNQYFIDGRGAIKTLAFGTDNTERGRINASGEWLLLPDGNDYGDFKLQVIGNTYFGGVVGVNQQTPHASAQLEVASITKGFLPPRMSETERNAISSPAAGLIIYNVSASKLQVYITSWVDLH